MINFLLSTEEYRLMVEQVPVMILRSKANAEFDYFNKRWLAFTGNTIQQEVGYGWTAGLYPEDIPRYLNIYWGSFAKQERFEIKFRLRRHDGFYRWIFEPGVPFYDAGGVFWVISALPAILLK